MYLVRRNKAKVYHVFIDGDTCCRLYSTGGMNKRKYKMVKDSNGLPMCQMCGIKMAQRKIEHPETNKELARLILSQKKDRIEERYSPINQGR